MTDFMAHRTVIFDSADSDFTHIWHTHFSLQFGMSSHSLNFMI